MAISSNGGLVVDVVRFSMASLAPTPLQAKVMVWSYLVFAGQSSQVLWEARRQGSKAGIQRQQDKLGLYVGRLV